MNETFTRKIWEILESKCLTKSIENWLHFKRRLYCFQLKKRISISEYINNYTKLLVDLTNMDEVFKDENKALILLSSLSDEEYEKFVLTLINDKLSLSYNDVSAALVNHEVRKKDKEFSSSSTTAETLTAKEMDFNHQNGKRDVDKSKTDNCKSRKNQCAFCWPKGPSL